MEKKGIKMNYSKKYNKNRHNESEKHHEADEGSDSFYVEEVKEEKKEKSMIVKTKCLLNVRRYPSKESDILTKLEKETDIVATEIFDNTEWYYVVTANGIEGYIMKEFVSIVD